jgi:hypothetical protein
VTAAAEPLPTIPTTLARTDVCRRNESDPSHAQRPNIRAEAHMTFFTTLLGPSKGAGTVDVATLAEPQQQMKDIASES